MLDSVLNIVRPLPVRGKGRILDLVTPTSGVHRVPVWGDYRMSLDLANVIHRQIFMGCFGREMTAWAKALLPRGGTFLDVGAHIGYFTLLAAQRVGPQGRVLAVEPNPTAFEALQRHLAENRVGHVEAHRLALAEAAGSLRLFTPPEREARDYNVTIMARPGWIPVDVPCERLDDMRTEWKVERVDLMKIDVEGAEPRVFEGGRELLTSGVVRHVIVEVNGPRLTEGGSSPRQLVEQLAEYGFAPARLAGGGAVPVPVESLDLEPAHEHDRLFVHRSAR